MSGKLILMMGIQGSGKSTFLKENVKNNPNALIVSRDEIRFKMTSPNEVFSYKTEKRIFDEYIKQILNGLMLGKTVYADATQLTKKTRANVLNKIPKVYCSSVFVIWIKVPINIALERNEQRRGTRGYVPQSAIYEFESTIQEPTRMEGISKLLIVDEHGNMEEKVL